MVTAEEHMMLGGLGESIAQLLVRKLPTPLEMVAVNDSFGESGKPAELMKKYGLSSEDIITAAEKAISKKVKLFLYQKLRSYNYFWKIQKKVKKFRIFDWNFCLSF